MRVFPLVRAFLVGAIGAALVFAATASFGARPDRPDTTRMQDGRDGLAGGQAYIRRSSSAPVICFLDTYGMLGCWPDAINYLPGFPTGEFAQVRVGDDHLCAVRRDGEVVCWGWGDCGQGECESPEGRRISLRTARNATCSRKTDWTVECWGEPAEVE